MADAKKAPAKKGPPTKGAWKLYEKKGEKLERKNKSCPKCGTGKMERIASFLMHNGSLVNVKDLSRSRTKNKASPPIRKKSVTVK